MSIATAIQNAQNKVANVYTAVSNKGGTLPQIQNLSNLPTAVNSIPTGSSPTINSLSITPTTSQQTIIASGGIDGYSPITVAAVTSSIDNNILAGNIKNGVSILGVTGNYSGTTPTGTLSITVNGVYDVTNYASADVSVAGGASTMYCYWADGNSGCASVDYPVQVGSICYYIDTPYNYTPLVDFSYKMTVTSVQQSGSNFSFDTDDGGFWSNGYVTTYDLV